MVEATPLHDADHRDPPGASVAVNLLRGFELVVDGARVDVPASAQRVLAYLALRARPQTRAVVASTLWLDVPDQRASANLRAALWKLRDLRDRLVATRSAHIALSGEVAVDVRNLVAGARRIIGETADGPVPDVAEPGPFDLAHLSGDLLPDWDEDWILFERERIRQLRVHAIEALSGRLREAGRYAAAIEAGLAAVAAEPLRESAHRAVIDVHLEEGNLADARRQFEALRGALWESLEILPSPELARRVGVGSDLGGAPADVAPPVAPARVPVGSSAGRPRQRG